VEVGRGGIFGIVVRIVWYRRLSHDVGKVRRRGVEGGRRKERGKRTEEKKRW
jgi:hypothetical protein